MRYLRLILAVSAIFVLASCGKENEDPSGGVELTAPANVTLVSQTTSSATFSWDAVKGASNYTWRLSGGGGEPKTGNTSGTGVTVDNLTGGNTYSFTVSSSTASSVSPWSKAVSVTIEKPETPGVDYYAKFNIPAAEDADKLVRAFPGAEGCGMFTTGGRNGKVIHVTNTKDSGSGSLRAALGTSGARTIVFDVAGRIELKSGLTIAEGDVTIAGQTAPGDGICISGWTTENKANNVIIRFIRFRLGDVEAKAYKESLTEAQWQKLVSDGASIPMEDCIWGRNKANIILDHCSMSWCVDECASFYDNDNFTMQYCILSESMNKSYHPKGNHGYGGIWGGHGATFSHNIIAHHSSRTPRLCGSRYTGVPANEKTEIVNNLFYNWGPTNGGYAGEGGSFNFINNYYKPGPSTAAKNVLVNRIFSPDPDDGKNKNAAGTWGAFHLSGNWFDSSSSALNADQVALCDKVNSDNWAGLHPSKTPSSNIQAASAFDISYNGSKVVSQSAKDAYDIVAEYAGASLKRDAVDARVVSEIKAGTAPGGNKGIIDSQEDVGGWPEYKATPAETEKCKDSDGDGMPDWFEDEFGLDKGGASDGNAKTLDKYGRYTNLEMYLHYLVKDIVAAQYASGK